jgi:hypothetical protein
MQQDPAILLDQTIPFDQNKLATLEHVIGIMYSGSKASDVSNFPPLTKLNSPKHNIP